ncbi:uncharacterized protein K441DRAFT_668239 [Cenococcum geophilum 1.58]|uniref:uncharacterized protein n=1 Tax=Cenococcum geophilum 1.58 TaxID=794803 RepID=UPI00358E1CEC|nr:hypothetical protein K441DRAFT_668239 [Cenococcum geophilum 1.58]
MTTSSSTSTTDQMTTSNTDQNIYLGYRSNDYPKHGLIDCLECRSNHYTSLNTVS